MFEMVKHTSLMCQSLNCDVKKFNKIGRRILVGPDIKNDGEDC
jgi:hypothetical protein